ncbi:MAG: radical SAM protein [Fibrobacter sp.]|nr:radical SAM protein [Fibrobacter sp.]
MTLLEKAPVKGSLYNLWRITLLTNPDACNLHCALCFLRQRGRSYGKGEMPWKVAEETVRKYAACGIREVIPSTMGEPLLYSEFENLERLVQELGLKLNVTTNGSFPLKGALLWAKELLPISNDIKVSCWGFGQKTWDALCPGMNWNVYIQNLKTLANVRRELAQNSVEPLSKLTIQMAVCQRNRGDVDRVIELAAELGFDRVKLNRAVFLSGSEALQKKEQLSKDDFLDVSLYKQMPLKIEGTFLFPATEAPPFKKCPFLGKELWILPDGSTEPCPDPENRFRDHDSGKDRCEFCHLFPKKSFSPVEN